jgi:hypothetical protein
MKKYFKKLLKEIIAEVLEERMPRIAKMSANESHSSMFGYIGVDRMQELLDQIKKRPKGHHDYTSLAEMYSYIQRNNLEKVQGDVRHQMFEIYPELQKLNKDIENL